MSAGVTAGAITAATFLGKFTQGLKWAHLDVAGTAYQGGAQKGQYGPADAAARRLSTAARGSLTRHGASHHRKLRPRALLPSAATADAAGAATPHKQRRHWRCGGGSRGPEGGAS